MSEPAAEVVWPENKSNFDPEVDSALKRLWADAEVDARDQRAKRERMARLVYRLGIPAGTLAAVAGSTAVAEVPTWITAGIALLSALLSAAMGVIAPVEGRIDHGRKAAEFAHFARVVWVARLSLVDQSPEKQLAALRELGEQRRQLDLRSPVRDSGPPVDASR
jgi:hypothetical protein